MCKNNNLINLIGGPEEVGGIYSCVSNKLISLEGYPKNLSVGSLFCEKNPIYEIYKLFGSKLYYDSLDYHYLRGTNIIKLRFQEACEEAGIKVPKFIPGYKYI